MELHETTGCLGVNRLTAELGKPLIHIWIESLKLNGVPTETKAVNQRDHTRGLVVSDVQGLGDGGRILAGINNLLIPLHIHHTILGSLHHFFSRLSFSPRLHACTESTEALYKHIDHATNAQTFDGVLKTAFDLRVVLVRCKVLSDRVL